MRTYDQWIREGRGVRKGEKAGHYLVSPDGSQSRAVFALEQTDPYADPTEGWTELVSAEARGKLMERNSDRRPKLLVDYHDGKVWIWCGATTKAIQTCQRAGYTYDPPSHRWTAARTLEEAVKICQEFERYDYNVTATDNIPEALLCPAI